MWPRTVCASVCHTEAEQSDGISGGEPPHQGSPEMATERPAEESHLMNEHFPSYQHISTMRQEWIKTRTMCQSRRLIGRTHQHKPKPINTHDSLPGHDAALPPSCKTRSTGPSAQESYYLWWPQDGRVCRTLRPNGHDIWKKIMLQGKWHRGYTGTIGFHRVVE